MALPDGSALVIDESGTALRFDPESGWRSAGALTTARIDPTVAVLADGCVLVAGGRNESGHFRKTAELFDPDAGWSSDLAPMPAARLAGDAVTLADGSVLVVGGCGGACAAVRWIP